MEIKEKHTVGASCGRFYLHLIFRNIRFLAPFYDVLVGTFYIFSFCDQCNKKLSFVYRMFRQDLISHNIRD